MQAFNPAEEIAAPKPAHLEDAIPLEAGEWRGEAVALGATEFVSGKVAQVLNYDDVFNARYRSGARELTVYVAYWGAGRMPVRLVASHTPDRCWTENGWSCVEMRFDERRSVAGRALQSADWRRFLDPEGRSTHVLFWHLIEGEVYDYGERFNAIPHPLEWWKDAMRQLVSGSREQYFMRIGSNVPFEEIWDDPGVQEIVAALAKLGLSAEPSGDNPVGQ
ncbi:hypothetical protein ASA1KI_42680 [Opitutales bacterium ASA1]|nr:hypothetical protein ASA1KI_42680 [Opitutales bacterium ASA1]